MTTGGEEIMSDATNELGETSKTGLKKVRRLPPEVSILAVLIGIEMAGLGGALAAQGVALLALHPPIARLAHKHRAWDMRHDLTFFPLAAALAALVFVVNRGQFGL